MGRKNLSPGTLTAPLPAVMVTVGDMENSNIITVAWTGILATHPPRAYISVRPSRHSYGMLKEGGEFVINLSSEKLLFATDFSGIYTGAKVDKFERLSLTKLKSERVAPPTIAEAPLSLECRVCEVLSMGTHDVFIADILSVSCDEALIDESGKIQLDRAGLIAYAHGEYYSLGKMLGKFGFSAAKKKPLKKPVAKPMRKSAESAASKENTSLSTEKSGKERKSSDTAEPFYIGALKYKKRRGKK